MKKFIKDSVFDATVSVFSFFLAVILTLSLRPFVKHELLEFIIFTTVLICGKFIDDYVKSDKANSVLVWGMIVSLILALVL